MSVKGEFYTHMKHSNDVVFCHVITRTSWFSIKIQVKTPQKYSQAEASYSQEASKVQYSSHEQHLQ